MWKESRVGGILCGRNSMWEEFHVEGIPCGRNPVWEEFLVGGIPCGRNPVREESCVGGILWEESRFGGILLGGIPWRNPVWEESCWEESHGRNPMTTSFMIFYNVITKLMLFFKILDISFFSADSSNIIKLEIVNIR